MQTNYTKNLIRVKIRRKEYQLHPLGEKGYSRISQAIAPKNYHSGNLGEAIVRYLKFTHTHTHLQKCFRISSVYDCRPDLSFSAEIT